jgi:shikimate dehydrogenase
MAKAVMIGYPLLEKKWVNSFNYWIQKYNPNNLFLPLSVKNEDLSLVLKALPKMGFDSVVADISSSKEILKYMDLWSNEAHITQSVTVVSFEKDGKVRGHNFMGESFIENIIQNNFKFEFYGKTAVILGTGASAKAVGCSLLKKDLEKIYFVSRHTDNALENIKALKGPVCVLDWNQKEEILPKADILVNATPLGMKGLDDLKINMSLLKNSCLVCDLVYLPAKTFFVKEATLRGLPVLDGLSLLLQQARMSFQFCYGILPDIDSSVREIAEG